MACQVDRRPPDAASFAQCGIKGAAPSNLCARQILQRSDMVLKQVMAAFERGSHLKFQMENHRITLAG
jgi:hypothetical protein